MDDGEFRELDAMRTVAEALSGLDGDERDRVLQWALSKFEADLSVIGSAKSSTNINDDIPLDIELNEARADDMNYDTFADFFAVASPSTAGERLLVAGYWHQYTLGEQGLKSYDLNKSLKNLGHGIDHMPSAFNSLTSQSPSLVMQTSKTKGKKGRKTYKLTHAGKQYVEDMIQSREG